MQIKLAVFDLAGTTVFDPNGVHECLIQAIAASGVPVSFDQANRVMGLRKPDAIRALLEEANRIDLLPEVESIHDDFVKRMKDFYRHDPRVREIEGATAMFTELRSAGIRVALNTGFDRDITEGIFERLGWVAGQTFDLSVCSDEVPQGRPYADMIRKLMQTAGVTDSSQVLKVGDTPSDLGEGNAAACGLVVGVTKGSHTREQMAEHKHTHLIGTVAEIPELLRSVGALKS